MPGFTSAQPLVGGDIAYRRVTRVLNAHASRALCSGGLIPRDRTRRIARIGGLAALVACSTSSTGPTPASGALDIYDADYAILLVRPPPN